jgi:hypothetical protein
MVDIISPELGRVVDLETFKQRDLGQGFLFVVGKDLVSVANFQGAGGTTVTNPANSSTITISSAAGVSLDDDNTWTGAQTFESGTFKNNALFLNDVSDDNYVKLKISGEFANNNGVLSIPSTDSDTFMMVDEAQTVTGTKTFGDGTFRFYHAGSNKTINIDPTFQLANRNLYIPTLANDSFFICSNATNQFVYGLTYFPATLVISSSGTNGVVLGANASQTGQIGASFPLLTENSKIMTGHVFPTVTLTAGTATVLTANIHTGDVIVPTRISGAGASIGITSYSIVDGVSFTLNGAATDDGTYAVLVLKP